jgi:hypothetical protein
MARQLGANAALILFLSAAVACGDNTGPQVPEREAYDRWIKVELPGTVCGNGSPYKFFVNYSETSNNLVVAMEPGGACWDYESCTGQSGIRGAANIDGIDDRHYELAPFIVPWFQRVNTENRTGDWNYVYLPYCTGDVHTGNNVVTYSDPTGEGPDVEFHHNGYANVTAAIDWMAGEFQTVPQLLVTGCSAGGAGATINYYYMRKGLPGVENGYLLADSGPIMPTPGDGGFSKPLHDQVYSSWAVQSLLGNLPATFDPENFGSINDVLATEFPDDRLSLTYFRRDGNYTLYSYERFYDFPPFEEMMDMWDADTRLLTAQLDRHPNFAYYIPYWRALNDSHCTTLIDFGGSEIEEAGVDLHDFADQLFSDGPLESYFEETAEGE